MQSTLSKNHQSKSNSDRVLPTCLLFGFVRILSFTKLEKSCRQIFPPHFSEAFANIFAFVFHSPSFASHPSSILPNELWKLWKIGAERIFSRSSSNHSKAYFIVSTSIICFPNHFFCSKCIVFFTPSEQYPSGKLPFN